MSLRKISNSWFADFYTNGKRTRRKLSTNKATAQKIYDNLIKQREISPFGIIDNAHDIKHLEKQFLIEVGLRVNAKTLHDYKVILSGVTDHLNGLPLQEIRNAFIEYLTSRQEEGISARRLNLTIELSKRMFCHAIETTLFHSTPFQVFVNSEEPRKSGDPSPLLK